MEITAAIGRLRNRDHYLKTQIEQRPDRSHWFVLDRESIALAIECLEYVQAVHEYEASQVPR
jgi:hypothetical protein